MADRRQAWEHAVYFSLSGVLTISTVVGFSHSFFLRPFFPDVQAPHEVYFYVHGVVFTGWFILLILQTVVVANNQLKIHRQLGKCAYVLVPVMTMMGFLADLIAARRPSGFTGSGPSDLREVGLFMGLSESLVFGAFATAALLMRRHVAIHKRLIIFATATLAEAGVVRWPTEFVSRPWVSFAMTCLILVPLAVWDLVSLRRLHSATVCGALIYILYGTTREPLAQSHFWKQCAAFLLA